MNIEYVSLKHYYEKGDRVRDAWFDMEGTVISVFDHDIKVRFKHGEASYRITAFPEFLTGLMNLNR